MRRYFGRFPYLRTCLVKTYPASAKIIISGFAENVCLSRLSQKATEAVPYISPALKALSPEKTLPAVRRLRRSSARESFAFLQGSARHSRLSQTVYPYMQTVTGKITVLPFTCRRADRPKAASELYGTSCRSTASRYIRISTV